MNPTFDMYTGFICIVAMTVVTFSVRALPFWVRLPLALKEALSKGQHIFPALFLTVLVVYCLSEPLNLVLHINKLSTFLPILVASSYVFIVHWWRENILLSLGGGVTIYLVLINIVI